MPRQPLPIDAVLPRVTDALHQHASVVLRAPTGAGKTTRVPPALLDAGLAGCGRIVMLEPRRLAARAAARRIAEERGEALGETIGYAVRFERNFSQRTRLLVVTPGVLLRFLLDDPYLSSTGLIVFDEFHERGLESDLALGMARLIQQTVRPELRLVVMSATLAAADVSKYLGDCPIVESEGRLYPVEIIYEPKPESQPWPVAAARAAERLLERISGDLLVFLPGLHEIRQAARHLEPAAAAHDVAVLPLHGDLPGEQQDAALLPQPRRKIVLATNVAETSVTVEGVTGVVDTGLARALVFDPAVGLDRLKLMPISRASAEQRTGRAGRTQPGVCVRLWSAMGHRARPAQTEPEIRRVDLAGAVLHLLCLGEKDVFRFPWPEPPLDATVTAALTLLGQFGAMERDAVTDLGRAMARLPAHPRIARLLIEGRRLGEPEHVALAAALLSERDPFARALDDPPPDHRRAATASDLLDRVEALEQYEQTGRVQTALGTLNRGSARFVLHARDQFLRAVRQGLSRGKSRTEYSVLSTQFSALHADDAVRLALLAAFPDRLARRREPGSRRGVMVGGRGVRLAPSSGVNTAELFLCLDVDAGKTETLARQASAVERAWLPHDAITTRTELSFDETTERVTAQRVTCFADLVLDETQTALPNDETTARILAEAAGQQLQRVLPPEDSFAALYRIRVRCLRAWMPELHLPAFDDDELRDLLPMLSLGCRSFADLRKALWLDALQGRLTHVQRQAVEREAPERLAVPSGSRITLRYEEGRPPVLAVRIQEVFGLRETPRVAGGRVRVLLHLLAPNYRPQQVTDDLASFWANTYPLVRKELRVRYPKHAWPEDPCTASPQQRIHHKGTKDTKEDKKNK